MKKYVKIWIMLMVLTAVFLVACGGEEEPTPVPPTKAIPTDIPPTAVPTEVPTETPTEVPPTATPEPTPEMMGETYESEAGGYTIDLPDGWFANELFGMGMFTSTDMELDAMEDLSTLENAIAIVMGGAMAELEGDDPFDMLDQATDEFEMEEGMEIVDGPTAITVNGNDGAMLSVRGDADGTEIYATIATLTNDVNSVVLMAISPVADEEENAPLFEAMVNSITISEEEITNPFGDMGFEDTPVPDAVDAGSLTMNEAVAGLILENAAVSWSFNGTAGTAYDLAVTPTDENLDVIVDVIDETGASILPFGAVDDSFDEEIVTFDIPADGIYKAVLYGFGSSNGAYTLILTGVGESSSQPAGNVTYSETVEGVVPENETITHEFQGIAGMIINVVVTPTDDQLDAVVDIIDADGNSIIGGEVDDSFGEEVISDVVIPADGTYNVSVRGFAGGSGPYELTYSEMGEATSNTGGSIPTGEGGGSISYGESATGEITSSDGNAWAFNASKGDFIDVTVEPYNELDVMVDVVDSAGNSLLIDGAVDASFDVEMVRVVPIPADGQYAVVVTGYDANATGSYDLYLNETLGGGAGTILFIYNEFTDPEEEEYTYPFTAAANEIVTLSVDPDGELDVVVGVYNEETDELIEEVDYSTGREELIFYAEELGNYYFTVSSYEGTIGGFDLILSGSHNMIPEIFVEDGIIGRVTDGQVLSYGYYGEAGTTVSFVIESDDNMDMVMSIEDLDGNILADVDDGLSGEGETLSYTFEEGLYIFVNAFEFYDEAGNFALYVE